MPIFVSNIRSGFIKRAVHFSASPAWNSAAEFSSTRLTVAPPKPPPDSFPPINPGRPEAASTRKSSSSQELPKRSRLDAWDSTISSPSFPLSPFRRASMPSSTRPFSRRTCSARRRASGSMVSRHSRNSSSVTSRRLGTGRPRVSANWPAALSQ